MQINSSVLWQLTNLLNSLFNKESLRRNSYIFNSLNDRMELPIKTVARERKVAQITSDIQVVVQALKQCPNVEVISGNTVKILMKGDEVIVRLALPQGKKINKKDIQALTKQMKCDLKENHDNFLIEFQSHAATVEFVERVKATNKDYKYEILEKNPYKCLEESINNFRSEKKNPKPTNYYESQQNYVNNYASYDIAQYYSQHYPIFIRKAMPSDDQLQEPDAQKSINAKKYVQKPKIEEQRPRFDSDEFPTFDKLNISTEAKNE